MRLQQITIACHDVATQTAWFAQHGWSATHQQVHIGHSTLAFEPSTTTHVYHYAMAVPTNSVAAAVRWCATHQIPLIAGDGHAPIYQFDEWGMQAIYFFDGAGNVAEFIGAYDASQPQIERFDIAMIVGISEIGVVSADVPRDAHDLQQHYKLDSFFSYNATFHPVGDADGRVIIVEPAREWYPQTGVVSTIAPVALTFDAHGHTHHVAWNQR